MKTKFSVRIGLAIIFLLLSAAAFADTYMKQVRQTDPFTVMGQVQPAKTETVEIWLGAEATRINNPDRTSTLVIFNEQKAYIMNHVDRSYAEMPLGIDKIIEEAVATDDNDKDSQAGAAAMRGMMTAMMQFEVSLKDTGEQQKIGAWQARKYMLTTKTGMGTSTSEIWATEALRVDMTGYWKATNAMLARQKGFADMVAEMAKIRGVVVKTISRSQAMGSEVKSTEELVEFVTKPAPAGVFAIPPGYRKVPMFGE
ncbi:MAG: DUF4412 domain-containing protein [Desulfobulbaceae bacterium]|nr:DUF4412 domain-containing protein [Desulfobulbaceae bacterium]